MVEAATAAARGLASKAQDAPRPTSFPQSELRAMDPAFPARLGDVTRFPSAVWFGKAEGPFEVTRSPGRRLLLAGSGTGRGPRARACALKRPGTAPALAAAAG